MISKNSSFKGSYSTDGFLIVDEQVVPDDLIVRSLQGVKDVLSDTYDRNAPRCSISAGDERRIQRITQIHHANNAIFEMLSLGRIGEFVEAITGVKQAKVWGSQLYYKPCGSGELGQVGFHCDAQHLSFLEGEVLTAWIPLTDVTIDSGPLTYINGSHKWGRRYGNSGGEIQDLVAQRRMMQRDFPEREWSETPVLLKAGSISFHHKNTFHGSLVNTSDSDRIAICFGILTEKSQFVDGVDDCGVKEIINNPSICPILLDKISSAA
ncbi:MAG: hypothetical protein COB04_11665 [Gammaproteobacteria bacterium]|nr:MAG: hypothetical protein COB04_11665 [Gammaproteobacteria bacterium]